MKRETMQAIPWAVVGVVAIAIATPGCSESPTHHTSAEVSEAKKKGKFEYGPLKDIAQGPPVLRGRCPKNRS